MKSALMLKLLSVMLLMPLTDAINSHELIQLLKSKSATSMTCERHVAFKSEADVTCCKVSLKPLQ